MTVPEDPVSLLASKSTACAQTHNRQTPMHIKQVIMRGEGKGVGRGKGRGCSSGGGVQHLPSVQGPLGLVLSSV